MQAQAKTLPICCKQHDDETLCDELSQTDAFQQPIRSKVRHLAA